jgi:lipopolysaccharide biosynthesis glycosyltransferase
LKAKFYTAYHMAAPLIDSVHVVPIHVGRAEAAPLANMIGDDTGENISSRNASYCELTALYWAWKNDHDATHLGLLHYRRVLDLENSNPDKTEIIVSRFETAEWAARNDAWLSANPDVDMIVPCKHVMGRTLAENYRRGHHPQDWDITRQIIAEQYPEDLTVFDDVSSQANIRLGNMFLMRRELLDSYCDWLFDILGRLENWDVDRSRYSAQQARYLGYVAERLLTVWVEKMGRTRPDLRLHEASIINLSSALVLPWASGDAFNSETEINIAFAADRAYLPHVAAMLASLLTHADKTRRLNLFFLHSDVPDLDREMLREVLLMHPDVHLHEINAGGAFEESYRSASRAPSNTTYNRFLLFDLLPDLKRLLYVDVDMIFCGDVAEIYDTEIGTAPVAAVPDFIMTRTLTGKTPTIDPDVSDLYQYHRDRLGLSDDQIETYFNAGLLLFNFTVLDVKATGKELVKMAREGRYLFRDQDILNAYFKGQVHCLDPRFNVFNTVISGFSRVPKGNRAAALAARHDPVVIHYAAGDYKPWNGKPVPMAAAYWQALSHTPFFSEVIAKIRPKGGGHRQKKNVAVRAGLAIAERHPSLRPFLMRTYAQIRRLGG